MDLSTINVEAITQYINIGIIALAIIGVLIGFGQGFRKSFYGFIIFILLVISGWFLLTPISNWLLDLDISGFSEINLRGVTITSIRASLPDLLVAYVPQLDGIDPTTSIFYEMVFGILVMVLRFVVLIVWLLLMATLFKFIFWIVWLFIKPKKDDKTGKKKKKTLGNRFAGAPFGLVKMMIGVFLVMIPVAGICSIGTSIKSIDISQEQVNQVSKEYAYRAVFQEDGIITLQSTTGDIGAMSDLLDQISGISGIYRNSLVGKIYGVVKIDEIPLDEYIFDNMLSFETNEKTIVFRQEIITAINVYNIINEATGGKFDSDSLIALGEDTIKEISDQIAKLEIIQVAIPVAVEVIVKGAFLDEFVGDYLANIDLDALVKNVKKIDLSKDITYVGAAIGDFISLGLIDTLTVGVDSQRLLTLETSRVKSFFNNLSKIELIDVLSDVATAVLLDADFMNEIYTKFNINKDDLPFDDIKWRDEIANMGNLYGSFKELGISEFTLESMKKANLTDEKVTTFTTALFGSDLISKSINVLAAVVLDQVFTDDSGFGSYINKEELSTINWDKDEFDALLCLGAFVINSGLVDKDENGQMNLKANLRTLLTDEKIDELNTYLMNSKFIKTSLTTALGALIEDAELPIKLDLTAVKEKDYWDNHPKEIAYILKTLKLLYDSGFLEDNADTDASIALFLEMLHEDENLDIILASDILSRTFVSLLTNAPIIEVTKANEENIKYYIINGTQTNVVAPNGTDIEPIVTITTINEVKYFVINGIITDVKNENILSSVSDFVVVPDSYNGKANYQKWIDVVDSNGDIINPGELRNILKAILIVAGNGDFSNIDAIIEALFTLTSEEVDTVKSSVVIRATLIKQLFEYGLPNSENNQTIYLTKDMVPDTLQSWIDEGLTASEINSKKASIAAVDSTYGWIGEDGEIKNLLTNIRVLLGTAEEEPVIVPSVTLKVDGVDQVEDYNEKVKLIADDKEGMTFKYWIIDGKLYSKTKNIIITANKNYEIERVYKEDDKILVTFLNYDKTILSKQLIDSGSDAIAPATPIRKDFTFKEWGNDFHNVTKDIEITAKYNESIIDNITKVDIGILFDDDSRNRILKSKVLSSTIVGTIIKTMDGNELISIPAVYSDYNNNKWYQTYDNEVLTDKGELRRILSAIEVIVGEDNDVVVSEISFDLEALLNLNDAQIGKIESSDVISATLIKQLLDLDNPAAGDRTLYLKQGLTPAQGTNSDKAEIASMDAPYKDLWRGANGEIRKLLRTVTYLLGDEEVVAEGEEINVTVNGENYGMSVLSGQKIDLTYDAPIGKEFMFWTKNGKLFSKEANLNQIEVNSDSEFVAVCKNTGTIAIVYQDYNNRIIEIKYFNLAANASKISININANSKFIVDGIETLETAPLNPVRSGYTFKEWNKDLVSKTLELSNDLYIKAIYNESPFDELSNMKLGRILNEATQELILQSGVLSTTIVGTIIKTMDGNELISIPAVYSDYNNNKWYQTYDNEVLTDKGELRRILSAIEVIVGEDNDVVVSEISFDLEALLNLNDAQIGKIESSDVISATLIKQLLDLDNPAVGDRTLYLKQGLTPAQGTNSDKAEIASMDAPYKDLWRGANGEIRKLLKSAGVLLSDEGLLESGSVITLNINGDIRTGLYGSEPIEITAPNLSNKEFSYWDRNGRMYSSSKKIEIEFLSDATFTPIYRDSSKASIVFLNYNNEVAAVYEIELINGEATFKINKNDESNNSDDTLVINGIESGLAIGKLSRSGYTFKEWSKNVYSENGITIKKDTFIKALYNESPFSQLSDMKIGKLITDNGQKQILSSSVLSSTIVGTIINVMDDNDLICIPEIYNNKLLNDGYNKDEWYPSNDYDGGLTGDKGELRKMLTSIGVIIGGDESIRVSDIKFDLETLINLTDEEIYTLEKSDIISATVIKQIMDLYDPTSTSNTVYIRDIYLPNGENNKVKAEKAALNVNDASEAYDWGWRGVNGEIYYLLKSIGVLLNEEKYLKNGQPVYITIDGETYGTEVVAGETIDLIKSPNIGYEFLYWTKNGKIFSLEEHVNDVVINNDADFEFVTRQVGYVSIVFENYNKEIISRIDVPLNGNESVNITVASGKVYADGIEVGDYPNDPQRRGYTFKEWTKDFTVANGITIDKDIIVKAIYNESPFSQLTDMKISKLVDGSGSQSIILKSNVLSSTIVGALIETKDTNDSLIIPSIYEEFNENKWYGLSGELEKALNGIGIILGDDSDAKVKELTFNLESIVNLTEEEIRTIEISDILSASIIKQILDLCPEAGNKTLYIDSEFVPSGLTIAIKAEVASMDAPYKDLWRGNDGEIFRFIKSLGFLLNNNSESGETTIIVKQKLGNNAATPMPTTITENKLTAIRIEGYSFLYWMIDGKVTSYLQRIEVTSDDKGVYTAVYCPKEKTAVTFLNYDKTILDTLYLDSNNSNIKINDNGTLNNSSDDTWIIDGMQTDISAPLYPVRDNFTFKDWNKDLYGTDGVQITENTYVKATYNENPFNSIIHVKLGVLTSENVSRENILASSVLFSTIRENIIDASTTTPIVIPNFNIAWNKDGTYAAPTLDEINFDKSQDNDGDGIADGDGIIPRSDAGELRNFLDAVVIALGADSATIGDLSGVDFSFNNLYSNREDILYSRIFEESIIDRIKQYAAEDNLIVLPEVEAENPALRIYWSWYKDNNDGEGELRRFLDTIETITGGQDLENMTTDADELINMFFSSTRDELLSSRIIEATVIKQIKAVNTSLTIPDATKPSDLLEFDYLNTEPLIWEKTSSRDGELIKFLDAISIFKGDNAFSNMTFGWSVMRALTPENFVILTESRVIEATLSRTIEQEVLTDSNNNFLKVPEDGYKWYRIANLTTTYDINVEQGNEAGEFGDLLPFLIAIKKMEECNIDGSNFTAEAIFNATSEAGFADALWYSRIIRSSIPKMLNSAVYGVLGDDGVTLGQSKDLIPSGPGRTIQEPYIASDFDTKDELIEILAKINQVPRT